MDKAKAAISGHLNKAGHHDTTVHEKVAPAVVHETINTVHREEVQTAIDKEVHQDHYHTSVQPIYDQERRAEQHHHNIAAVEERRIEHGNDREIQEKLRLEAAQFKSEVHKGETKHTQSVAPTVAGEHIHHHVHETIQPVVHKQTVEPHVTHTIVPIHEVHHNAAQHHTATALPAVSLADFKKQGGSLTGREERYDGFEGEPRSMVGKAEAAVTGHSHSHTHGTTGTTGLTGTSTGSGLTGSSTGRALDGTTGTTGTTGSGLTGSSHTSSGLTGTKNNDYVESATGTGPVTGSHGAGGLGHSTTTGSHTSSTHDHDTSSSSGGLLNKIKSAVSGSHDTTTETPTGASGSSYTK